MDEVNYQGILCIGDPHLCCWAPGYRKDDYPQIMLEKLQWAFEHARQNHLLPVLLGDLFHVPRDNANWLISRLMVLLQGKILTIIGNHDLSEDVLCDHDSLKVLLAANRLQVLQDQPWIGTINQVPVMIGGTNNGQKLPKQFDRETVGNPHWVFWVAHHDIQFPGYEDKGYLGCREIPGIDLLVNGHLHRQYPDVSCGQTTWCNPGNIARVARGDATTMHRPGVLRIDVTDQGWTKQRIEIPHGEFGDVFHPVQPVNEAKPLEPTFITGLQAMQKFRTADGEGLRRLIEDNLPGLENDRVKTEIMVLLEEVLDNG